MERKAVMPFIAEYVSTPIRRPARLQRPLLLIAIGAAFIFVQLLPYGGSDLAGAQQDSKIVCSRTPVAGVVDCTIIEPAFIMSYGWTVPNGPAFNFFAPCPPAANAQMEATINNVPVRTSITWTDCAGIQHGPLQAYDPFVGVPLGGVAAYARLGPGATDPPGAILIAAGVIAVAAVVSAWYVRRRRSRSV